MKRCDMLLVCGHGGKSGVPTYVNFIGDTLGEDWDTKVVCSENEGAFEKGAPFSDIVEVPGLHRSINPVVIILALISIIRILNTYQPRVVWANSTIPVILIRISTLVKWDFQLITTYHGVPYGPGRNVLLGAALFILDSFSLLVSRKHTIVFISTRDEQLVPKALRWRHEVVRIENCSDLKFLRKNKSKSMGVNTIKIGMVGRVSKQKNFDLGMQIFDSCPDDFEFFLVGDGTDGVRFTTEMKTYLSPSAQQRVHFLGPCSFVGEFLGTLDCLLFTSRYEGMSIAAIEGLQVGLALASTDVGGLEEFASASPFVLNLGAWNELLPQEVAENLLRFIQSYKSDEENNRNLISSGWEKHFSKDSWRAKVLSLSTSLRDI